MALKYVRALLFIVGFIDPEVMGGLKELNPLSSSAYQLTKEELGLG